MAVAVVEMSAAERSILGVLRCAPARRQSPAEIAVRVPQPAETTADGLLALTEAGWLEIRHDPAAGPMVALSPLGAQRLGLRLAAADDPPPAALRPVAATAAQAVIEREAIDPSPGPLERAAWSERAAAVAVAAPAARGRARRLWRVAVAVEQLPRPSLLVGTDLVPWPGPDQVQPAAACPACHGRRLGPQAYCLLCDRWGLDWLTEHRPRRRA